MQLQRPEEDAGETAMNERVNLRSHLDRTASQLPHGAAIGDVIDAISGAAIELASLIADGPLAGITGQNGAINHDGDQQKDIDVAADDMMRRALRGAPVAAVLSEESALPETLDLEAPLCVAIDPLDGSANLENNISVGTIFSIRPRGYDIISTFFEPGTAQCAAGFIVYGPQTTLVLALNASVDIFILDRRRRQFLLFRCHPTHRNSRSMRPTGVTGTDLSGPTSTNALPAPTGTARRISTCGGSDRWSRSPFESWCVAACFFIRPMLVRGIAKAGFACCTKPIRWLW
jgi:Fructose-1-6-bisphosphatase, N-terminal domain